MSFAPGALNLLRLGGGGGITDPWAKFQLNLRKDKGPQILTSNDTNSCLIFRYHFV